MNARTLSFIAAALLGAGLLLVIIRLAMPPADSGLELEPLDQSLTSSDTSTMTDSGELKITDRTVGTGDEAVAGKKVTVHYVGTLEDGTKFDSSRDRGEPFTFTLGAGQVIKGWDQGVAGMKVGGTRILNIPADLAYGDRAVGSIPAGSALNFEVELLGVE